MLPWPFSRVESAPVLQIAPAQAVVIGSGVRKRRLSLSAWLQHYEKPGVAPPSARVDPLLQQREGHGIGIWDACKLGAVVALKGESRWAFRILHVLALCLYALIHAHSFHWALPTSRLVATLLFRASNLFLFDGPSLPCANISYNVVTEMAGDVLSHHVWGPRKKSWGIQMTIFTSLMRDAGRHSDLVDIVCDFSA